MLSLRMCHFFFIEPPSFTSQPMSTIIEEKENVTFTCSAYGDPIPNITWSKENGTLPVGRSLVAFDSLSLWSVLRSDSGNYTCTATSTAGTISSSAELHVHSVLEFTTDSSFGPFNIFIGDSLIIPCLAKSDLKPKMTWLLPNVSGVRVFDNNTLFIAFAELSHAGTYICQAENDLVILQGFVDVYVHIHRTCHHIKIQQELSSGDNQVDTSGIYFIDPDGEDTGVAPFLVFCNMSMVDGTGATLVSHDSENRTEVNGFGPSGSYIKDISYTGVTLSQIVSLMKVSESCHQFIKYECYKSALLKHNTGYWVSREGEIMEYWGGASPGSGMCACGETLTCISNKQNCNCDTENSEWLEDSGYLSDESTLPVTQLRFGDTDHKDEVGYHTLGKLVCYGQRLPQSPN